MLPMGKSRLDKKKESSIRIVRQVVKAPKAANAQKSPIERANQKSPIKCTNQMSPIRKTCPTTITSIRTVKHRIAHRSKQQEVAKKDADVKTGMRCPSKSFASSTSSASSRPLKQQRVITIGCDTGQRPSSAPTKRRPSILSASSRPLKQQRVITIGSDCTGLGTDEIAMRRVLGLECNNVFASEINPVARRLLIANGHAPAKMYEDITSAARRQAPQVDVYTAGFPCQPYSAAGLNLGMADPRCVVSSIIHYIKAKLPTLFVLENVKNILSKRHKAGPTQHLKLPQPDAPQCAATHICMFDWCT